MRSLILAFAIAAAYITPAHAQFKLGLQGGAIMSRTMLKYDTRMFNTRLKPGYTIALNGEVKVADRWYVQVGLTYMRHHVLGRNSSAFNSVLPTSKAICHTLQVPAVIVYKFGRRDGNRLGIGAGGYAAWNVRGFIYWQGGGRGDMAIGSQADYQTGRADDIKEFDYGVTACVTYELKNGLYFHGRCSSGMANMLPGGNATYFMRTQAISLSAGYYFRHLPSFKRHARSARPAKEHKPRKLYPAVDE